MSRTPLDIPLSDSHCVGTRCGHDPKRPLLTPANPIRKGKGGLPRILSLAAGRTKAWYSKTGMASTRSRPVDSTAAWLKGGFKNDSALSSRRA